MWSEPSLQRRTAGLLCCSGGRTRLAPRRTMPSARQERSRVRQRAGRKSIPKIEPYLADPVLDVRLEAVKAIVDIGTQRSLDPLIKATARQRSRNPDSRHRRPGEFLCARLREDRADGVAAARWARPSRANSPTPTIR